MEHVHSEDSSSTLVASVATLTHCSAATAATVLASNPGWLLLAASFWKAATWIQKIPLVLLWINTNECFISYTTVSFLLREEYFTELTPTKISLILLIWSHTTQQQDLGKYLTIYETTGSTANILLNLKVILKQQRNWTVKTSIGANSKA